MATGSELGGPSTLARYEREAKLHDSAALATVHSIWSTMQWRGPLLSPLRAAGMALASGFAPLKRSLVQAAAGKDYLARNQWD
jgi:hypothetical protein